MKLFIALISVLCIAVCFLGFRIKNGVILVQDKSKFDTSLIVVRKIQRNARGLSGILALGDPIYRCDYIPHPGWPVVSSISIIGESYFPSDIVIQWDSNAKAKVIFDNETIFLLESGIWSEKK